MFKDKGLSAGLSLQGRSAISSGCKDYIAGGCMGNFQKSFKYLYEDWHIYAAEK
jgi:hypothetical protein